MSRDIKFRVWFHHQEKFQYGGLEMFSAFSFPLSWCDIQSFTNLVDKNHKEIYEGDIVMAEFLDEYGHKTAEMNVVVFNSGAFVLKHISLLDNDSYCGALMLGEGDLQVIGNMFENPELLKK